jgi:uncharacterized protein YggT (Ycf19 family)
MKYFIGNILYYVIGIYILLLTVRVLISWINLPQNIFTSWLCRLTDPVLDFFRRNFPIRFGIFDLSIMTPVAILLVLGKITNDFLIMNAFDFKVLINAWYILSLVIFIADIVIGFILGLYIIITLIVIIFKLFGQQGYYNQTITYFYGIINPFLIFLGRFIRMRSKHNEVVLLFALLAILIILNILKSTCISYLDLAVNAQLLDINIDKVGAGNII